MLKLKDLLEIKVQPRLQVPVPEKGENVYVYFSRAVSSPYSVREVRGGYNIGGTTMYMKNALEYFNGVLAYLKKVGPVKIIKKDVRESFDFENTGEEQVAYTINIQTNPYITPVRPDSEERQEKTYTWELPKGGERLTNYLKSLEPNITVKVKMGPSVVIGVPNDTWSTSKMANFFLHVRELRSQPHIKSVTRPHENQINIYLDDTVTNFKLVAQSEHGNINEIKVQPKPQLPGYLAPFRDTIDYFLTSELEEPDYRAERNFGSLTTYLKVEKLNGSVDIETIVRYLKDYSKAFRADKRSRVSEIKVASNSLTSPQKGETVYDYIRRLFEEGKFTERHGRKYRTVIFTAESDQRPAQLAKLLSRVMKVELSYHPEDAGHYESYHLTYNRNPYTTEIIPAKSEEDVSEIVVDKSPQIPQSLKPYKDRLDYYITHSQEVNLDDLTLKVLTYMLKLLGQDGVNLMKEVDLAKLLREVKTYVTAFKDYIKRDLKEIRVEPGLRKYKDRLDSYIKDSQEQDLTNLSLQTLMHAIRLMFNDGASADDFDLPRMLREIKSYVVAIRGHQAKDLKEIRVEPRQPVLVIGDRYLLFEPNPSVEGWVEAEYVGPYELSSARPYEEFNAQGRTFLIKKRDVLSRVKPAKVQEPKLELEQFEYYEVPGHNNTRVSSRYITRMWDTFYFLVETDTNESNYYVEIPIQEVDQKVKVINKA